MQLLIDAGANIEARAEDGMNYTPLIAAAFDNESAAVVQALIDAGADLKVRNESG